MFSEQFLFIPVIALHGEKSQRFVSFFPQTKKSLFGGGDDIPPSTSPLLHRSLSENVAYQIKLSFRAF